MKKRLVLTLPFTTTALTSTPALCTDRGDLTVSMSPDDNGVKRSTILRFVKVRAHRHRTESLCTSWHVRDVYDKVCEIVGSDWRVELKSDAAPEWRDKWTMCHFMIYFDSFGCLECIAESVTLNETGPSS